MKYLGQTFGFAYLGDEPQPLHRTLNPNPNPNPIPELSLARDPCTLLDPSTWLGFRVADDVTRGPIE